MRSWWQRVRKPLEIFFVIVGCITVIALLVVIALAYIFNVNVPGLRGKTLWDWLQLLIIPLVLAVIALVFQLANSRTERQIANQRYEQDQQIALDKQREDLLQAYLDRMSDLLLKEKLRSSEDDTEVRNVARVRTITVLFQLDARRIGYVFAFLREAGLNSNTSYPSSIVNFEQADLKKINFSQADLSFADLSFADLSGADLSRANLNAVNLRKANLDRANLSGTNLSGANLSGTNLSGANLSGAVLSVAVLDETDLSGANLSGANFTKDDLFGIEAVLSGVDLSGADLTGTLISDEQLKKARSLKGATMPDGTKHA